MNSSASMLALTGPLRRAGPLCAAAFPSSPPSAIPDLAPRAPAPAPGFRPGNTRRHLPRHAAQHGGPHAPRPPDRGNPSSLRRRSASLVAGCVCESVGCSSS
uniref:Uncharacterized protein n=1 Tax=Arundo donax TaxID=35708 RepID=A0A0A9G6U3_ARUDO